MVAPARPGRGGPGERPCWSGRPVASIPGGGHRPPTETPMRRTAPLLVLVLAAPLGAAGPKAHRGLAYAELSNERQTLDVYAPAQGTKLPVVVWIHGGGWQAGDKNEVHHKPPTFADKGFVFVSINYRLLPRATIQQMAQDVAKAIRWVH